MSLNSTAPNRKVGVSSTENGQDVRLSNEIIRTALPDCQPQEGSPANTFTDAEIEELQAALPNMKIRPRGSTAEPMKERIDILEPWHSSDNDVNGSSEKKPSLDWHGAPSFSSPKTLIPRSFRDKVRQGLFTGPTNAVCPGFLQCNLVVLPQGQEAFDFLLFCQRNPKACPLIDVCDVGCPCPTAVAPEADLRTDVPKYAIYRNGKLDKEVSDATPYWPENSVAFLIGCSFSYDGALMEAGIPLRSADQGKNVPMYRTSLKCRSAGSFRGNVVVSMKPVPALSISKHVEITSKYTHAHGGPVCIGRPDTIGVENLNEPDWGEAVDMAPDDVPVFHACGVTPQSVLMDSKISFAITHAAGHMFVTDLPSHMGVV